MSNFASGASIGLIGASGGLNPRANLAALDQEEFVRKAAEREEARQKEFMAKCKKARAVNTASGPAIEIDDMVFDIGNFGFDSKRFYVECLLRVLRGED